jgi:hypothetical protein
LLRNILPVNNADSGGAQTDASIPNVVLNRVAGICGGGDCPTVYRTDRGTLVVQGYLFDPAAAGATLPTGEQMVEIPPELIADYIRATA